MAKSKAEIVAQQNQYTGEWDVGWQDADGFTAAFCGYRTKQEAEAVIPDFNRRLDQQFADWKQQKDAEEREQNERWPNLGYVRAQIKKMAARGTAKDKGAAFDAALKLNHLLDMDLHEHISWPLPSWKAINSNRVYGR
jgi:hypothetical protein